MSGKRAIGLWLLIASLGISACVGIPIGRSIPGGSMDLQVVYYATKCLLQHCDPYKPTELRAVYQADAKGLLPPFNYLPPTFLLVAPLTGAPWDVAALLWLALLLTSLFFAALLMVQEGTSNAPVLSLTLACIVLANIEVGIALANAAVLVVSLCTIAVYFLLRNKFVFLGQVALASALALKPHDSFLILVYLFFAARTQRMHAWKIAGLTFVVGLISVIWTMQVSPHWIKEWQANITTLTAHGGLNDPGPTAEKSHNAGQVVDLQAAISLVKDEPAFYDPASYCICGVMLAIWSVAAIRTRFSANSAWIAIATAVPLTLLITYHRPYDAKLLLLAIPACALLHRKGGGIGRTAVALTTAAIVATADLPLLVWSKVTAGLDVTKMETWERVCMIPIVRPAPMMLLAMAVFYLWIYVRNAWPVEDVEGATEAAI
jgi:hypothetical protein